MFFDNPTTENLRSYCANYETTDPEGLYMYRATGMIGDITRLAQNRRLHVCVRAHVTKEEDKTQFDRLASFYVNIWTAPTEKDSGVRLRLEISSKSCGSEYLPVICVHHFWRHEVKIDSQCAVTYKDTRVSQVVFDKMGASSMGTSFIRRSNDRMWSSWRAFHQSIPQILDKVLKEDRNQTAKNMQVERTRLLRKQAVKNLTDDIDWLVFNGNQKLKELFGDKFCFKVNIPNPNVEKWGIYLSDGESGIGGIYGQSRPDFGSILAESVPGMFSYVGAMDPLDRCFEITHDSKDDLWTVRYNAASKLGVLLGLPPMNFRVAFEGKMDKICEYMSRMLELEKMVATRFRALQQEMCREIVVDDTISSNWRKYEIELRRSRGEEV